MVGQPEVRDRSREAGFHAFLLEPVGLGALEEALQG